MFNNKLDTDLLLNISNYELLLNDLVRYLNRVNEEIYQQDIIINNYSLPKNLNNELHNYVRTINNKEFTETNNFSLRLYSQNNILFLNDVGFEEQKKLFSEKIEPLFFNKKNLP